MFRNILVPVDGSSLAEQALPFAARIARASAARVHVVIIETVYHEPGQPAPSLPALERAVEQIETELDESVTFEVLPPCAPAHSRTRIGQSIATHARTHGVDLIVATTHGRGALSRSWMGSVADTLVRTSPCPILLVRPRSRSAVPRPALRRLGHVVAALDGSSASETIVPFCAELVRVLEGHLTLLHVLVESPLPFDPADHLPTASGGETETDAKRYLENVAAPLRAMSLDVGTECIEARSVTDAISTYTRRHRSGIVAVATSGWSAPSRWLLGSVADKVVRSSERPVLVVSATPAA